MHPLLKGISLEPINMTNIRTMTSTFTTDGDRDPCQFHTNCNGHVSMIDTAEGPVPTVTAQQMARVVRQRRRLRFAKQQQRLTEFSDWLHEELRPQGTQQTRALKRALLSFRMVKQKSNHALRVRFARFVRTNNVLRIHWAGLEQAIGAGNVSPAMVHCIASCIPIGAPPCEPETQAAFAAWVRKSKRALAHFGVLDKLVNFTG
eukprot:gene7066-164_t